MSILTPSHWIGTDVGLVRQHNEDAFLWLGPEDTGGGWLWLVADGLGGEAAGDVASALLTTCFEQLYEEALAETGSPPRAIDRCVAEANRRILHVGASFPDLRGLGTTMLALAVHNGQAWVAHVGDSRCYWLHRGSLTRLTEDHRRTEALIELGHVSRAAAESSPEASLLTRMLGHTTVEVDHGTQRPIPLADDVFLLCSDGVWSVLPEDIIREALLRLHARDAVEALVELARQQWSDDNLTACVVRLAPPEASRTMSRESFVAWAAGGVSKLDPGRTMVLQAVRDRSADETPPRSNVSGIPRIQAAPRQPQAAAEPIEQTQLHSPERIASLVAAASAAEDDAASTAAFSLDELQKQLQSGSIPSGTPTAQGTMAFSVDAIAAATGRGARPPLRTDQVGVVGDSTAAFSPDIIQQLADAIGGTMPPGTTGGFSRDASGARGNRSTLFFSADSVARATSAAAPASQSPPAHVAPRAPEVDARPGSLPPTEPLDRNELSQSMELAPIRSNHLGAIVLGIAVAVFAVGAMAYMAMQRSDATDVVVEGSAAQ